MMSFGKLINVYDGYIWLYLAGCLMILGAYVTFVMIKLRSSILPVKQKNISSLEAFSLVKAVLEQGDPLPDTIFHDNVSIKMVLGIFFLYTLF